MKLGLPIVWDDRDRLHEPGEEVRIGVRTPGTEVPRRAEVIRDALRARDTPFVDARPRPDDAVLAVHDTALVDELRTPWDEAGLAAVEGLTASATANGGKTLVVRARRRQQPR